jgi:hypothetical protein
LNLLGTILVAIRQIRKHKKEYEMTYFKTKIIGFYNNNTVTASRQPSGQSQRLDLG